MFCLCIVVMWACSSREDRRLIKVDPEILEMLSELNMDWIKEARGWVLTSGHTLVPETSGRQILLRVSIDDDNIGLLWARDTEGDGHLNELSVNWQGPSDEVVSMGIRRVGSNTWVYLGQGDANYLDTDGDGLWDRKEMHGVLYLRQEDGSWASVGRENENDVSYHNTMAGEELSIDGRYEETKK